MRKLKRLEEIVEEILKDDKLSRKDDCYLIFKVVSKLYPNDVEKKFKTVMFNAKEKGISFESITRCRRKIQEKYPELKDKETAKSRKIIQNMYVKYSQS